MYGRRRFYRRPARKYLRKRKATGKRSTVSSRIKKYVKRELHRNVENKERAYYQANQTIQTGDPVTSTYPLLISTSQGTNEENRIGNSFKVVKGQLKMVVNLLPYNATYNSQQLPCWVKVWVVRDLQTQAQLTTLSTGVYNNLFRAGATTYGIQGTPLDVVAECNKDYVRVLYQKTFKLGASGSLTGSTLVAGGYFDNSPMAKMLTINWGKWCKKIIKCADGSSSPTNENLYLIISACAADGSSSSGKQMIEIHHTNLMHFEDA